MYLLQILILTAGCLFPSSRAVHMSFMTQTAKRQPKQPKRRYPNGIDFVACNEPQTCSLQPPSHWMGDLIKEVDQPVRATDHVPAILHIGGAGFGSDEEWVDSSLYNGVHATGAVRFWLVEAAPTNIQASKGHMKLLNFSGSAEILNAFVADNCTDKHFYDVDKQRVKKDFGFDYFFSWESMSRTQMKNQIRWASDKDGSITQKFPSLHLPPDYDERLRAWVASPNFESYLVPLSVPCLTPSELLDKIHVKPEELAMVVTDIEGGDLAFMNAFLDMPAFQPSYLQFEITAANVGYDDIVKRLHKHGYSVGVSDPQHVTEHNMIGVRSNIWSNNSNLQGQVL